MQQSKAAFSILVQKVNLMLIKTRKYTERFYMFYDTKLKQIITSYRPSNQDTYMYWGDMKLS